MGDKAVFQGSPMKETSLVCIISLGRIHIWSEATASYRYLMPRQPRTPENMSKIPGLYINVGKEARDLLYKDFARQPPIHFHKGFLDWNCGLHFQIVFAVGTVRELSGFEVDFRIIAPYTGKGELRYLHDYAGITAGIGLTANTSRRFDPVLSFSGLIGTDVVSVGSRIRIDLSARGFSKIDAGIRVNTPILIASFTLDNNLGTIAGSCYRAVNPLTRTSVAAELKHRFSRGDTSFTLGTQHAIFPHTLIKARISTKGEAAAVIQQGLWKFLFTFVGEVGVRNNRWVPKIGFSMELRQ